MSQDQVKNPAVRIAKLLIALTDWSYKKIAEMIKSIIPTSIIGPRYLATIAYNMRKGGMPAPYRR